MIRLIQKHHEIIHYCEERIRIADIIIADSTSPLIVKEEAILHKEQCKITLKQAQNDLNKLL